MTLPAEPYSDSMSVKVVDDKTVEMKSRKGGRDTFAATLTVSADGNTLTAQVQGFVDAECAAGRRSEQLVSAQGLLLPERMRFPASGPRTR